jgi:diguanylate cyclase (GGDEF)-like protein
MAKVIARCGRIAGNTEAASQRVCLEVEVRGNMAEGGRTRRSIAALRALFRVQTDKRDLMQSQVRALSKQVPLLYFILLVNVSAVAYTHFDVAPKSLTLGFPIIILFVFLSRVRTWMKAGDQVMSDAALGRLLKMTAVLGPAIAAIIFVWGIALYQYGDAYAQGHVAFFMGITVISCIFCLMHLRAAALWLTGVAIIPFTIFFLATGRPVFIAIALNMLLVSMAMIYILLIHSRDFASMIAFQSENARLANLDSLTELPNRRQFFSTLNEVLGRATREKQRFVVGMIDLDGFKSVNDLNGHAAGDRVLIEAGRRMQTLRDEAFFLSRLGGDEFGVIVDADLDDAAIQAVGDRICKVLAAPFMLPDITVEISGSVGFAAFPRAGSTAELLFERADYSLYHAKQHRRGHPIIFSIEHETEIRRFGNLERCLRHADVESEMSLYFQPIVDVERGKIVAFEALARWDSPILGRVAPDVFIRVAERSDRINNLTRMLLPRALAKAKTWPSDIRVSFNLSTRDLGSREAFANIVAIIVNSEIAPSRLDLEVTETALIQDFDQANASLRTLKALGIGISLDDFGTGYSSLSYLQQFPIDKIKIDRSFIKEVETKPSCRAIVKSVIDLCRNLKLTCIVEGMETDDQVHVLRALGCTIMQGYLFGKPMPGAEVVGFLDAATLPWCIEAQGVRALAS